MARLSKQEQKLHDRAMELINSDRPLTYEEKEFCYNNYHGDGLGGSVHSLPQRGLRGILPLTHTAPEKY